MTIYLEVTRGNPRDPFSAVSFGGLHAKPCWLSNSFGAEP